METLTFTRRDMAQLLTSSSSGSMTDSPLSIIQHVWRARHHKELEQGNSMSAFIATSLPSILERMIQSDSVPSFSLHDIVSLGAQIEYTNFSVSLVQNWVKRDFKDMIGHAEVGKRYSIQQAAIFFMIEDLRSTLDYEALRNFFRIAFPHLDKRGVQQIRPLTFYAMYAELFEELDERYRNYSDDRNDLVNKWDQMIHELARDYVRRLPDLSEPYKETLQNALHVALISVHTACFQALARRYVNGMVFLHDL